MTHEFSVIINAFRCNAKLENKACREISSNVSRGYIGTVTPTASGLTLRILLGFLSLDNIIHDRSSRCSGVDRLGIPVQECIFVVNIHLLWIQCGLEWCLPWWWSAHQPGEILNERQSRISETSNSVRLD